MGNLDHWLFVLGAILGLGGGVCATFLALWLAACEAAARGLRW
jgi:hypothetical protein